MLSVILIKLEGGGDGGQVLDGDHLLLRHGLELPDGVVHYGGELRPERRQNFCNQSFLVYSFLLLECGSKFLLPTGSGGGESVVV